MAITIVARVVNEEAIEFMVCDDLDLSFVLRLTLFIFVISFKPILCPISLHHASLKQRGG
jgi:hypothetical protein